MDVKLTKTQNSFFPRNMYQIQINEKLKRGSRRQKSTYQKRTKKNIHRQKSMDP